MVPLLHLLSLFEGKHLPFFFPFVASLFLPLPLGPEETEPLPLPYFPAWVSTELASLPAEDARAAARRARGVVRVSLVMEVVAVLRRGRQLLAWGVVFAEEVKPGVRGD